MDTVGKLLVKKYLPPDVHSYVDTTTLDKKGLNGLFGQLAERGIDTYKNAVQNLTRVGFEVATQKGSTISLNDLKPPVYKDKMFDEVEAKTKKIRSSSLSEAQKASRITSLYQDLAEELNNKIVKDGVAEGKTLAQIIASGSRGSATQYRQTIAAPVLVEDNVGNAFIDVPVRNSFAEGLTLPEYLASTFGARKALTSTKLSVANAGFLGKQIARAASTIRVEEDDCNTPNGVPISTNLKDAAGYYLAKGVGSYARNNLVTNKILNELKAKGITEIYVRSPLTCRASANSHAGAVCKMCLGKREKDAEIKDFVGITAATGIAESLAQSQLSSKHSGHVAGKSTLDSGFDAVNQFVNIPSSFRSEAVVAEDDGIVNDIRKSAGGGTIILVGVKEYFVEQGLDPIVKVGDKIEEGQVLSEGIPNPAKIVKHKGIGEGRRFYSQTLRDIFDNSGMKISQRNFDVLAKANIDTVRVDDPEGLGDYLPDQIVSYQTIERDYTPRPTAKKTKVDVALGSYLEEPVLHYTIGTKVTSEVASRLKKEGINEVTVDKNKPKFTPMMHRVLDIPETIDDFFHQMNSTYLKRRLISSVNSGTSSSLTNPSPVAALAYGGEGLGR